MNKSITLFLFTALLVAQYLLFPAIRPNPHTLQAMRSAWTAVADNDLKQEAFAILETRCNACHRKQNPFRVFSLKNMEKNASRIHDQVFVKQRMPKGDAAQLTDQESQTLQNWLNTLSIK